MPSVFISYRHEDDAHCARVLDLARQLEGAGITVILDALAQEREFNGAGPDSGWPHWSRSQARNREHKILIVASCGWFRCYLNEDCAGDMLGSAAEAVIIAARLYRGRGHAAFFRIVKVTPFDNEDIPDELGIFQTFRFADDFKDIVRWLNAGPSQQPPGRGEPRIPPARGTESPPSQPPQQYRSPPSEAPAPAQEGSAVFNWCVVEEGPYRRGFSREEVDRVIRQITDQSIDVESVRALLNAEPQRNVLVSEFHIARELVTNTQFRQFVGATGYRTTAERNGEPSTWRTYATAEKANHPVVQVSFEDAQAFCTWAGVRLPALDQWMKAYRGPEGYVYPWGNEFSPSKCNTEENKTIVNTSPVDMFSEYASTYGCCDMIGNVNEWVDASGDTGPHVRAIHPAQIEHLKRTRAVMGGAWSMPCQAFGLPVMNLLARIDSSSNDLGFRVVR